MELLAVIVALEKLKSAEYKVKIYTDSKYVEQAVNKGWIYKWKRNMFSKVKNVDLWKRFIPLYEKYKPEFIWIKGHNKHPQNERCDRLAVAASQRKNLKIDRGYEDIMRSNDLFS